MILVVGATGLLGGEICRRLRERGHPVRALARETSDPAKVQRLTSLGAEIMRGDLKDRASLDQACRGAATRLDRKSTRLNSSHANISYAVFCLKKKNKKNNRH